MTDSGKREALIRIFELTTLIDPNVVTRRFPMPSYPSQDAIAYIDKETYACLFFHANDYTLWSAKKLSEDEMGVILTNQDFKNLN